MQWESEREVCSERQAVRESCVLGTRVKEALWEDSGRAWGKWTAGAKGARMRENWVVVGRGEWPAMWWQ